MKLAEKRAELLDGIPAGYSGALHFAGINAVSLAAIGAAVWLARGAPVWAWALVPAFFAFANAFEWWVHRGPLHHRTRGLATLYERHARRHHVAFTDADMEIRSARDLKLVLFPPFVLPLMLLLTAPLPAALWLFASRELAVLFWGSAIAYYLVYEWLHTLHHWPRDSRLGRRRLVAALRRHHTRHHDPRAMTQGNFNVSFPLTDWVLRSTLSPGEGEGALGDPSPRACARDHRTLGAPMGPAAASTRRR